MSILKMNFVTDAKLLIIRTLRDELKKHDLPSLIPNSKGVRVDGMHPIIYLIPTIDSTFTPPPLDENTDIMPSVTVGNTARAQTSTRIAHTQEDNVPMTENDLDELEKDPARSRVTPQSVIDSVRAHIIATGEDIGGGKKQIKVSRREDILEETISMEIWAEEDDLKDLVTEMVWASIYARYNELIGTEADPDDNSNLTNVRMSMVQDGNLNTDFGRTLFGATVGITYNISFIEIKVDTDVQRLSAVAVESINEGLENEPILP